jgi:cysteine rich repeat protein
MRALISALLLAAVLMPMGLRPASAQVGEVLTELMANCRRDAAELCPDVEPGGGRVAACLYSRLNDLSPPCHRAMRDGIALRACKIEYDRFCGDVQIGDGQVARCLRDFRGDVSPKCAEALAFSRPHGGERWSERRWDSPPPKAYSYDYERKYSREYSREYDRKLPDEPEGEDDDVDVQDLK